MSQIRASSGGALDEVIREVEATGAEYFGDLDPEGVWLPDHANDIYWMWQEGNWLPQEWVGLEVLMMSSE